MADKGRDGSESAMAEETLTCAKCGQPRSIAEFDRRFIGKGTRITCSVCRAVIYAGRKWPAVYEQSNGPQPTTSRRGQSSRQEPWYKQYLAERAALQREEEAQRREEKARTRARKARFAALGITDPDEQQVIERFEDGLRNCGRPWAAIRADYLALDPPYIHRPDRRSRPSQAVRECIYTQQDGRCAYCGRALLPLSVWRRGPDGRSVIDRMSFEERHNRADSGIPELDHRTPPTRGGDNAVENLCYACRRCNQSKEVRTEAEFRAFPHDPITQLGFHPGIIAWMISMEERCRYPWDTV